MHDLTRFQGYLRGRLRVCGERKIRYYRGGAHLPSVQQLDRLGPGEDVPV